MTLVLVHGAYHGGWCWDGVKQHLGDASVFAPTLAGLAERKDESAVADLDAHIGQIVQLIDQHNLHSVHLVGWSYGGMVITGVLSLIPDRIAAVTYLDAHLPGDGQSAASFLPVIPRLLIRLSALLNIGLKPPDPQRWGIDDEVMLKGLRDRLTSQPPRTLTQSVSAPEPWPDHVRYRYIWCEGYRGSMFGAFCQKARADQRFQVVVLASGHASPMTHPVEVAQALMA